MECNLCFGEFRDDADRCPWCINPVEADGDVNDSGDWRCTAAVVRGDIVLLDLGRYRSVQSHPGRVEILRGRGPLEVPDHINLTPLEAHRLARWILGNVDLPDGVEL